MSNLAARPRLLASSIGLLLSGLMLQLPDAAQAAVKSWSSAVDGLWQDPARWSPAGVPAATDTVRLEAPGTYTVTLQGSATVARLSVGGTGSTPVLWLQGGRARGNAVLRIGDGASNAGTKIGRAHV